ncbi:uncharacterized protein STEHIDRAFT_52485, partial [Stereum hirsutum FP-91666 SS1]|uniref:uncharacterized protein n=1 Tax=Stereum hirsutum (strain FP-91666) TaxID=721885 RepID=UPI000440CF6F
MVIAACRTTQLSFTYTKEKTKSTVRGPFQRYVKGNVAIIPQDIGTLNSLLPSSPDDGDYSVCVLFVGQDTAPSMDTIRKMHPLLVNKDRVSILLRFLVANNKWYRDANISFSEDHLDALCSGPGFDHFSRVGVPTSLVEIQYLPDSDSVAEAVNSGPVDFTTADLLVPDGQTLLQVSGFTGSGQGAVAETTLKARALQWCLDHKPFLSVRSGNRLFPERDPRMLSFAFPHLDPWGIGGFNNPLRHGRQQISMGRQVKNLINKFEGQFKTDPQFAYVCFNAIQKLDSYRSVQFRVKAPELTALTTEIADNQALLEDMATRWADDPSAKPSSRGEKRMAALIRRLEVIMKDIHGSNGRKVVLRNEIRAMLKSIGCPALF